MNYPNYQQQQPQYPPQYPPTGPNFIPPTFTPPAQGYPQPEAPAPAAVNLDDFLRQASVGAPSWSWKDKPIGHTYVGQVSRELTAGDVRHNADMNGKLLFNRDGSPQAVLWVPFYVQSSTDFPNGEATWIVNTRHRDELRRAMSEAGSTATVPEVGAVVSVTLTERRKNNKGNPTNIVRVTYQPPTAQPAAAPVPSTTTAEGPPTQSPVSPTTSIAVPENLTPEQAARYTQLINQQHGAK